MAGSSFKPMKNTTLLEKIKLSLLGLCFAGISFCGKFLWDLNAWKARMDEVNSRQDITITALTIAQTDQGKESRNQSDKIIALEAVLPAWFKKNFK